MSDSGPESVFRDGAVNCKVWRNEKKGDSGEQFYSITVSRSYKDKDGNWRETNSFSKQDAVKLPALTAKAYDDLLSREQRDSWRNAEKQESDRTRSRRSR